VQLILSSFPVLVFPQELSLEFSNLLLLLLDPLALLFPCIALLSREPVKLRAKVC
jgi:hypothetical protein